jgi:secreted trypsin-like serine protease
MFFPTLLLSKKENPPNPHIVNSKPAELGEFPYFVNSVRVSDLADRFCGRALITKNIILTLHIMKNLA